MPDQVVKMVELVANNAMFALLAGWELVLILGVILVLLGAKRLPWIARGFGKGLSQFRKEFDEQAHQAGESLGGIYGKPAAEALTPDNQTAELYDPAVFHNREGTGRGKRRWRFWRMLWHTILKCLTVCKRGM